MAQDKRWRFNPFTETYNPVTITGESHIIAYSAEFDAYGIFCDEAIQFDNPSSVSIAGYTEVARLTAPTGTQFRVDYAADTFWNTGFIEFHSSKVGLTVSVNYKGRGTLLHPSFRTLTTYNFAGTVHVEDTTDSSSSITGAFTCAGGGSFEKSLYIGGNFGCTGTMLTAKAKTSLTLQNTSLEDNALFFSANGGDLAILSNAYASGAKIRETGYTHQLAFNASGLLIFYAATGAADSTPTYVNKMYLDVPNSTLVINGKLSATAAAGAGVVGSGTTYGAQFTASVGDGVNAFGLSYGGVFKTRANIVGGQACIYLVRDDSASDPGFPGNGIMKVFAPGLGVDIPPAMSDTAWMYGNAGELWVKDSAGNITQISPHDENGNWIYSSSNDKTGKKVKIDMEKFISRVGEILNENFFDEFIPGE